MGFLCSTIAVENGNIIKNMKMDCIAPPFITRQSFIGTLKRVWSWMHEKSSIFSSKIYSKTFKTIFQGENMDTDESRLFRDESRLSRDESRVFRDESRISRDESRLSRDEYSLENTPFIQVDSMKMESIESIKHEYYPTPSHTPRRSASRLVYC